jgi:Tfp pilus assembly protein PilF
MSHDYLKGTERTPVKASILERAVIACGTVLGRMIGERVLLKWGMRLNTLGYYRLAIITFGVLSMLRPALAWPQGLLASSLWMFGKPELARKLFAQALATTTDTWYVEYLYAECLSFDVVVRGRSELRGLAIDKLREVVASTREPEKKGAMEDAMIWLAGCLNSQESDHLYEEVIRLNPDNAFAHYGLGLRKAMLEEWNTAVAHLQRAVELDPRSPNANYELGNALCNLQRWQEADGYFREAIARGFDRSYMPLYGRALCALEQGDSGMARRLANKAIRVKPDYVLPRELLAEIETGTGKRGQARKKGQGPEKGSEAIDLGKRP